MQAPSSVVMVRPHYFSPNVETEQDNAFQVKGSDHLDKHILARSAYDEVSNVADKLTQLGVNVHLFEDTTTQTPDSVFPNNWFTANADGTVCLFPMYANNRRLERRSDIVETLKMHYQVSAIIDMSYWELQQEFLEGTGALVFDHMHKTVFVCRSNRATEQPLNEFSKQHQFTPICFSACDNNNTPVYHTNVMMCVTSDFVIIADQMIKDKQERQQVINAIDQSGKQLVSITEQQVNQFAGNMLELTGNLGRFIVLSSKAYQALNDEQIEIISDKVPLVPFDIPTIELAGGSIRCMLAGIHLPKKNVN